MARWRFPDQTVKEGKSVESGYLVLYFEDPDSDVLRYRAESDNTGTVTVGVRWNRVTVTGEAQGTATVTVTATDECGDTATQSFTVEVLGPNQPPEAVGTIPDQTVKQDKSLDLDVDLDSYFEDADSELTYSAESSDQATLTVSVSGNALAVTGEAQGTVTVTVTATDECGDTATQSFTVEVLGPNQPPEAVGTIPAQTVKQGKSLDLDFDLDSYFRDVDSYLTYTAESSNTGALAVNVNESYWRLTVTGKAQGTVTVTVTAEDECGDTATQSFTVEVLEPNRPPVSVRTLPDQVVKQDKSFFLHLDYYFEDVDSHLTYTAESSRTGILSVSVNGIELTVTGEAQGTDTVTVTAEDECGETASQRFIVEVVEPNQPPVPVGTIPNQTVKQGKSLDLDFDLDSYFRDVDSYLTYTAESSNTGALAVNVNDSYWTLTVTGKAQGTVTVTVTAEDECGETATQSFRVEVLPPNRAPVVERTIPADTVKAEKSRELGRSLGSYFDDPDGDALEYEAESSNTGKLTVSLTGGVLTLAGVAKGSATVTVTATDDCDETVSQSFTVTVRDANRAPVVERTIPADTVKAEKSRDLSRSLSGYFDDPDGDALEYEAESSNTGKLTVSLTGGVLTLAGVAKGSATVTVTATDDCDETVSQSFTVTVRDANRAPVVERTIPADTVKAEKSRDLSRSLSGYFDDPDGDALEYEAESSNTGKLTVSLTGGVLTLAGVAKGSATVTVTATDDCDETVSQSFTVTVRDANRAPVVERTIPAQTLKAEKSRDLSRSLSGYFDDPDGDALEYEAESSNTGKLTVSLTGGVLTLAGVAKGSATVTVTATDDCDETVSQSFTVTVRDPNRSPVVERTIPAQTLKAEKSQDLSRSLSGYFDDPDGDALEYEAESSNTGKLTVSLTGGVLTLAGVAKGSATVTVTATDTDGLTVSQAFEVTVVPSNAPPAFNPDELERAVAENTASGVAVGDPVVAEDPDTDDTMWYSMLGSGIPFSIGERSGQIRVSGALDYESGDTLYTVKVEASDGELADTATVTIRVTDVPVPPEPDQPVVTGGQQEVEVSWSEPGDGDLGITGYLLQHREKDSGAKWDSITPGAGLTHTIAGLDEGTTYEVQIAAVNVEGTGAWSVSGEGMTDAAPNEPPVFNPDEVGRTVAENTAAEAEVGAPVAAEDPDTDTLSYSLVGGSGTVFSVGERSGQIRVSGALDYESGDTLYTVKVEASDGELADTATVTIRVTDVPVPPEPDQPVVTGGQQEVEVSWSEPGDGDLGITGYLLQHREKDSGAKWDGITPGAGLTHTIAGLDEGTTYEVQIAAVNVEGTGAWSVSGEGMTDAAPNEPPVFNPDEVGRTVAENTAAEAEVGAPVAAEDPDTDTLSYSLVGGSGTVFSVGERSGQIRVSGALDYESGDTLYTVKVEASDGELADTATVTIRVTDVPVPPEPDQPVVTGGQQEVEVSWSEPGDGDLGITGYLLQHREKDSGAKWDTITPGAGLTHTIAGLDEGTTYEVQIAAVNVEGTGAWSVSGEGMTDAAPNEPPVFNPDELERAVAENTASGVAVGDPVVAEDPDTDTLWYRFVGGSSAIPFSINETSGQITVDEPLDYESDDTVHTLSVVASDMKVEDTATVTVRVTNEDDPGVVTLDADAARVGVAVKATLMDQDGSKERGKARQWQLSVDDGAEWTDIEDAEGRVYTPVASDQGKTLRAVFTYDDGHGQGKRAESEAVRVTGTNQAPEFPSQPANRTVAENTAEGTEVGDPVTAMDANGDTLAYSFVEAGDGIPFSIEEETGHITVAGALDYENDDTLYSVDVEASDGALADTITVTIRVTNEDDPGVATLNPEDARVGVEITARLQDEDGSKNRGKRRKWQLSTNGGSSWSNIGNGNVPKYTPVTGDQGKLLRVVFTYDDGHGPGKRAESEAARVTGTNQAPEFPSDSVERTVAEDAARGEAVGDTVSASDPNGDDLAYSFLDGDDTPFAIEEATGLVTVAAALDYESGDTLYTVNIEASDGTLSDTAEVTIRVTDADDAGVVTLDPGVARVGESVTATLADDDGVEEEETAVQWQRSADEGETWMNINGADTDSYTPAATDQEKLLRAMFTYTDGHGSGKRAESEALLVVADNVAPEFAPDAVERAVAENTGEGDEVGGPVTATDANGDTLAYSFVPGGDEALFAIGSETGQITVGGTTTLDYESGDTVYTVTVEASDGTFADTATVTIRITNADDPGVVSLDDNVGRVNVQLAAVLMDEDGSKKAGKKRWWRLSEDGGASWTNIEGATTRFYTPAASDEGNLLRAVFTYRDGHGPGKRAESDAVPVVGEDTPVVSFETSAYTVFVGESVDVGVVLSPAADSTLAVELTIDNNGTSTVDTVTFESGDTEGTVQVSAAGLSESDTITVAFGTLPNTVVAAAPSEAKVVVVANTADMGSRLAPLAVEYAEPLYTAVAGGTPAEVTLRITPAANREVVVPVTVTSSAPSAGEETGIGIPDTVVFAPGDSLRTFAVRVSATTPGGEHMLGFGTLPDSVSAGPVAAAVLDIAGADTNNPLFQESLDIGLAVFGRAVAEGARQAIGGRIETAMRPQRADTRSGPDNRSAAEWATRALGGLTSAMGGPRSGARGTTELPNAREAAGRLLPRISFSAPLGGRQTEPGGRFSVWGQGSAQGFRGDPGTVTYDGSMQALSLGADARIGGSALAGFMVMRSDGDFNYTNQSLTGTLGHAMTTVHPYVFIQPSPKLGLWATAGYGTGSVEAEEQAETLDATLRMAAGGVRVPLARRGGFGLGLSADAFGVRMATDADGAVAEGEGTATRARAVVEVTFASNGLKAGAQAGGRYDGGDADTGAGAEAGVSLGYAGGGVDLAFNGRVALGSNDHREWGVGLRLAWDPGTSGQGFRFALRPARGQDRSGVHGLLDHGHFGRGSPNAATRTRAWRFEAETGYRFEALGEGALDTYSRLSAGVGGQTWTIGAGYNVASSLRLSIEAARNGGKDGPGRQGAKFGLGINF